MIRWRDDVDFEKAVVEALVKNGLSVRSDQQRAGRRMVVREGDAVRVKYLPKNIKLLKTVFGRKNNLVTEESASNKLQRTFSFENGETLSIGISQMYATGRSTQLSQLKHKKPQKGFLAKSIKAKSQSIKAKNQEKADARV